VSPDVSKTIVPITNADELLRRPRGFVETYAINGVGAKDLATVPVGLRWRLFSIDFGLDTGTWTFTTLMVRDSSLGLNVILDSFAAATSRTLLLPAVITLEAGDQVMAGIDSHSVAGNSTATLWLEEEDTF